MASFTVRIVNCIALIFRDFKETKSTCCDEKDDYSDFKLDFTFRQAMALKFVKNLKVSHFKNYTESLTLGGDLINLNTGSIDTLID
jgi:hypothetical protein